MRLVCVCVSVTTLAEASFISMLGLRYKQLYYVITLIFNRWIYIKLLCSGVICLPQCLGEVAATLSLFNRWQRLLKANGRLNTLSGIWANVWQQATLLFLWLSLRLQLRNFRYTFPRIFMVMWAGQYDAKLHMRIFLTVWYRCVQYDAKLHMFICRTEFLAII